jgi:hypothetical protein
VTACPGNADADRPGLRPDLSRTAREFPDYGVLSTPATQGICAPADANYTINVDSILGYSDPVTLSVGGNPAGTTSAFSVNPVIPVGSSVLTIGNTAAATPGSYTLAMTASSTSGNKSLNLGLNVYNATPGSSTLSNPADGASNVPPQPSFSWSAASQAATYTIQVASDAGFNTIVASASGVSGTSWNSNVTLNTSSTYYWRVWADNMCGTGTQSQVNSFNTQAAPGDCGIGSTPNPLLNTDFESGLSGWSQGSGGSGTNTWAISSSAPHAGAAHLHANDTASATDQRMVSPSIALPSGQNPVTLKFWHRPDNESSSSGCYDGGILEVSNNGGTSWTQVPAADILVGGYTGAIAAGFSNPLAGLQAWCGVTSYQQTIVDVSGYAGQNVQFRYRLGTDSSVGDVGWDVDDVSVQSCNVTTDEIFQDGFEL